MSITLFSVTLAGAIEAINAIDNLTTSYVSEGEQSEVNHADFSNAYDRISQNLDPLRPLAEQAMCNTVQDRDSVQVCDSPSNSTKYCYVEFKISNMPTDPSKFVKLDEVQRIFASKLA